MPSVQTSKAHLKDQFSFDILPQEILTKDSVTITVDGVVYYKITNANEMGLFYLIGFNVFLCQCKIKYIHTKSILYTIYSI